MMKFTLVFCILSSMAWAQQDQGDELTLEDEPAKKIEKNEPAPKLDPVAEPSAPVKKMKKVRPNARRYNRSQTDWTVNGSLAIFDLWVTPKYGLTLGYNASASNTFEFDYMHGKFSSGYAGIEVSSVTEDRIGLIWRSFGRRSSFSLNTGVYYNKLQATFGSTYIANVTNGNVPKVDLLTIETLGISWGLGNRWQSKGGFVWGFDWLTFHIPLVILEDSAPLVDNTSDENARKNARDARKLFAHIPGVALMKVQLGFSW